MKIIKMFRNVLIAGFVLLSVQFSFGQDVFRTGKTGINIGVGYKAIGDPVFGCNMSIERTLFKSKKFGYFGLAVNSDILFSDEILPSATIRMILHPNFFRSKKWDIYTGTGLAIAKKETDESTMLHPDVFFGFRYKIKKSKFGLFSELSLYGANFKAGICFIL